VIDIKQPRSKSKRRQRYVKTLTVQIGGGGGTILKFRDRSAWALHSLIEAGEAGVAPLERPAPRWSLYVSIFRQKGLAIETVLEPHDADRSEPLVVLPLKLAAEIAAKAARHE
jgi:hypothetical protein